MRPATYSRTRAIGLRPAAVPVGGVRGDPRVFADEGVRNVPTGTGRSSGSTSAPTRRCVADRRRVARPCDRRKAFFLDGIRYRNAAAFENLVDSGFSRTLSEDDLEALLSRVLAFLTGDDASVEAETTAVGPLRGSSCAF